MKKYRIFLPFPNKGLHESFDLSRECRDEGRERTETLLAALAAHSADGVGGEEDRLGGECGRAASAAATHKRRTQEAVEEQRRRNSGIHRRELKNQYSEMLFALIM